MKIEVTLDITSPAQKYLNINYKISGLSQDDLVLCFATWSPGSYLIREYQAQITSFEALGSGKKKLAWQKTHKAKWQISTKGQKTIQVSYRVYAHDLNVRGVYADHKMVFINPTAGFFFVEGGLNLPIKLAIKPPKSWKLALAKSLKNNVASFKDFDEFFDTPIFCAQKMDVATFKVKNTAYTVAIWGRYLKDFQTILKDLKEILRQEIALFRDNPCKRYVFQIIFAPKSYGGLEHSFSSTNIFDGEKIASAVDYKRFLSLLSHEHFHLWNVKRIRPQALGPFDYVNENHTRELWIAEGITSYYDDHFVYRARIYSQSDYLKLLSDNITRFMAQHSSSVDSLSASSFDAWIRFYRQNENSLNTTVSYYLKGGLVMMLLDFYIIQKSRGKKSLDDVMRGLYALYKKRPEQGITRKEFFDCVRSCAEVNTKKFIRDYIDGTKEVSWRKEFQPFGILLKEKKSNAKGFLGLVLEQKKHNIFVKNVVENSPAYHSNLQAGDEVIAMDGVRMTGMDQLDQFLNKNSVQVLFSRLGSIDETPIRLSQATPRQYALDVVSKPTAQQKRYLAKFLRYS